MHTVGKYFLLFWKIVFLLTGWTVLDQKALIIMADI